MKDLFKNFWTTIKRFRTSSLLNVIGLAVAFVSLYIIAVQVDYDLFYNHKIKDAERIYRIEYPSWYHKGSYSYRSSRPVAERCLSNIAAVESFGCGNLWPGKQDCIVVHSGQQFRSQVDVGCLSKGYLKVAGFEAVFGNLADLSKPSAVAITESTAKRLDLSVGDDLFLGSSTSKENRVQVVCIFKDFPSNTDVSKLQVVSDMGEKFINNGREWGFVYYAKLTPGSNSEDVAKQFVANRRAMEGDKEDGNEYNVRLLPLTETYYSIDVDVSGEGNVGSRATTYTMIAVAALIIIIAFINFINFFFALVPIRIRSINTRKVFGCSLLKLRSMLVFESIGLIVIALAIAAVLMLYLQDSRLAQLINTSLSLSANPGIMLLVVGLALSLALVASLYPAYYITSFPTAMVVKGSFGTSKVGRRLRYILVGFQFTISIALIICAMFVHLQHWYMMNYDMGFNKEMVLTSNIPGKINSSLKVRDAFNSKLLSNPNIKDVAWADGEFVKEERMGWSQSFKNQDISFQNYPVSWDFLRFMGITVVEGRDFTESDEAKDNGSFIFNLTAKKRFDMSLEDKVEDHTGNPVPIVGFCKDFNFRPLQYGIEPFCFYVFGSKPWRIPSHLYFRIAPTANIDQVIDFVKDVVVEFDPDKTRDGVEVKFFDEELQKNYEKESNLSMLITLFSVLAIIISLMGVFGLVMFETQYRMKEIAVRRVHGATVAQVLSMFNLKFVRIVAVCFVIAAPASYLLIHHWLGSYMYQVPIYWWVFAVALLIVLLITVVTVTVRSYSAATSDPAKMVKSE